MRLVVGLGNPGSRYAQTRHNIGWLVLDELAAQWGAGWRKEPQAQLCEIRLEAPAVGTGQKLLLIKPQTFMNASGQGVGPYMQFYKLTLEQLLVVQDDLDSPFGLLRLRSGGRHGGQNGVRDLIRVLGGEGFARLKLGISRPPAGRDPADWVLSQWRPEEEERLRQLVGLGAQAIRSWALEGLSAAQAQFNSTDLRPPASAEAVKVTLEQGAQDDSASLH